MFQTKEKKQWKKKYIYCPKNKENEQRNSGYRLKKKQIGEYRLKDKENEQRNVC